MEGDSLLVVKLNPNDQYCCLPGGTLEIHEKLESCIAREIKEELGVEPKVGNIMFIHELVNLEMSHLVEFFFEIKNPEAYKNISLSDASHGFEISEVKRINIFDKGLSFLPKGLIEKLKDAEGRDESKLQIITTL